MAPFSQFIQRIVNHIANEVLIKGLANSKTFQRFAVRTDASLQTAKKQGTETFEEMTKRAASTIADGSNAAPGTAGGPPVPPLRGFPGFVRAFVLEVQSDLGGGSGGK